MNSLKQLRVGMISQSRNTWKILLILYLAIGLFFLVIGLLSRISDNLTLAMLMRDAIISGRLPIIAGVVSRLGHLLWTASFVVCIFSWAILRQRGMEFNRPDRFLLQFSLMTAILLLDDLFQFHGDVAPKYLGINKLFVLAAYLLLILYFFYSNRQEILSSEYTLLLLALGLFSVSSFLDLLPLNSPAIPHLVKQARYILEDAVKFTGIATWLTYFSRYGFQKIRLISGPQS